MRTRLYTPEDYEMVCSWWVGHGKQIVPAAVLPKCGVIVDEGEGVPVAAGWLYQDNSVGVAWMAWVTTRPRIPGAQAEIVLSTLIAAIETVAAGASYQLLFTATDSPGLCSLLDRSGFSVNHSSCTQYFKKL